jgi:hypothetical protein
MEEGENLVYEGEYTSVEIHAKRKYGKYNG